LNKILVIPTGFHVLLGLELDLILYFILDFVIPYIVKEKDEISLIEGQNPEDQQEKTKKIFKSFLAVTLHNIPEGVAYGLVFGVDHNETRADKDEALTSALGLSIGIEIQNIPEGLQLLFQ
jgi:ZIP family zinc transporter